MFDRISRAPDNEADHFAADAVFIGQDLRFQTSRRNREQ